MSTEASPLLSNRDCNLFAGRGTSEPEQSSKALLRKLVTSRAANEDTSWKEEVIIGVTHAAPLVVTFILQYSIDVSSIIVAGRLGKVELGAVSCKPTVL